MGELQRELSWNRVLQRLKDSGAKLKVKDAFSDRIDQVHDMLDNDKSGLVATIYEFMVSSANVPFKIVTENKTLKEKLENWATYEVNKDVNNDVSRGLKGISEQLLRERWTSSFCIAKISWEKIGGIELPKSIYFLEPKNVEVVHKNSLKTRIYKIGEEKLVDKEKISYIIRKPFAPLKEAIPSPYFVKKGVLHNYLLKSALKDKQANILEEIIPYLLILKAGDRNLVEQRLLGDLENQLTGLKDSIRRYKRDYENRSTKGDSIFKGRYDVELQHFLPELDKIFNEAILRPLDIDMLYGLGLIELQGFGTRQEALMNPKVLFQEIENAVKDLAEFYFEIFAQIVERNKENHSKYMNSKINVIPGVIKATITDNMKKLIKDYANTGQLSIEDSFEILPIGFDFNINRTRRIQEKDRGDEDLFFPRVILNQDNKERMDVPVRPNITPQEVPQKKKNEKKETEEVEFKQEVIEAPYDNINRLPDNVKNVLPIPAQITWLKAFNSAYPKYGDASARKIAWSAVKRKYKKGKDGKWVKKHTAEKLDAQLDELNKMTDIEIKSKQIKLLDKLLEESE